MVPKPLLQLVFAVVVAAILLWGLEKFPTMDATLKQILWVAVIVAVSLYVVFVLARWVGIA